jgi:hypothetical protein
VSSLDGGDGGGGGTGKERDGGRGYPVNACCYGRHAVTSCCIWLPPRAQSSFSVSLGLIPPPCGGASGGGLLVVD